MKLEVFMKYARFIILLTLLASACTAKPFPHPLAPTNVPIWETPEEMPPDLYKELEGKYFQYVAETVDMQLYRELFVHFPDSIGPLPVNLPSLIDNRSSRFSHDGRYYAYISGLPPERKLYMVDLYQKEQRLLVSAQHIPGAGSIGSIAFEPDNRYLIARIIGNNLVDLVQINLPSGDFHRLYVSAPLTPWTDLDVAPDGAIIVQCFESYPDGNMSIYLCLLDAAGRLMDELTPHILFGQGHPESAGRFTPDGQWVVYDWQHRLYKVSRKGGQPMQIAPCTVRGPVWVTTTHTLTPCYVRKEPKCYALYAASLDGNGFYRLGFIPEVCPASRATQEAQKR